MSNTGSNVALNTEPWSEQAVFLARDLGATRWTMKQIKQELQSERRMLSEQKRILEQMTSLLNAMLDDNAKGMAHVANEVHTLFDTLIEHSNSLKGQLSEDIMQSFRSALLMRVRRSQAQLRQIRTSMQHLPCADQEEPESLDINQLLTQIFKSLPNRQKNFPAPEPRLDHQIKIQKYPPMACTEALKILLEWRYRLAGVHGKEARFHIRTGLLNQYIEISLWDNGGAITQDQLKCMYDPISALKDNVLRLAWAVHSLEIIVGGHVFFNAESGSYANSRMIILLPITAEQVS
ncbi:MAG: hypothetical protein K9K62_04355 [Desulfobacteraceae bacterium]|nr:hypothetical protein [Desulfobacteraceae bacterium]